MAASADSRTSPTLLELVRDPSNVRAWEEFVRRYRPKIYGWCREWGAQEADADDVAQIVLAKLTEAMRDFRYDPARSFRAWLKTVTHHAWSNFVAGQRRGGGTPGPDWFASMESRDDLERRLQEEFDHELLETMLARIQRRVEPQTWEAFRLTALEGLSGAEASARLGLAVVQVFVSKHRVQQMLRAELGRIGGPGPA